MISGLSVIVTDVTHNPCSDLEVPREDNLGVASDDIPQVGGIGIVQISIGVRVVVVGRLEVGLGSDVPCPDASVRTLPISHILEIKVHVTPLDEVSQRAAQSGVTVTGGVMVLPVGELIVEGKVEP